MLRLSFKNIIRKRSRALLIFILSVISAFNIFTQVAQKNSVQNSLKKLITEAISGQYIIYDSEENINVLESQFSDIRRFEWRFHDSTRLLEKNPNIKTIERRLRFGGMLSYGEESLGILFQALSQNHLQRVSTILDFKNGSHPRKEDQIMLSETFADELEASVGDTLVVLANNKDGYLSDNLLCVSGIFKTIGPAQFLLPIGFINYEKGREILRLEGHETTELLVNYHTLENTVNGATTLKKQISSRHPRLKIATWEKSAPLLNAIVGVWVNVGYAIKTIFIVFSVLVLVNIIIMMTNHRKKEIGTLLAFGFTPYSTINAIALEYIVLISSGILLIGGLLKLIFDLFLQGGIPIPSETLQAAYLSTSIFPKLYWSEILWVTLSFGVACYLAVLVALRKLFRSEITTLLRTTT
ncbi:MAG: FtsX-like permease family protein [Bacteroidota bacterium]